MDVLIVLDRVKVPGATGYVETDYRGKLEYALAALVRDDVVFVHIEAPDEAGHSRDAARNVRRSSVSTASSSGLRSRGW